MYSERNSVFSLILYLQHLGVTPQGPEGEWERTPAWPEMQRPHGDCAEGRFLCWPPMGSAAETHRVVGTLAECPAPKSTNSRGWGNHRALPSSLWQRTCCALAPWRWRKYHLESRARLVTFHSTQSLPLSSSCVASFSAPSSPAPEDISEWIWHFVTFSHLMLEKLMKMRASFTEVLINEPPQKKKR